MDYFWLCKNTLLIMARYKVSDPRDYLEALDFINQAKEKRFDIELKKYYEKRSSKQNRYYHFVCAYFAHCYGCTVFEAENVYMKQYAARHIFLVEHEDPKGKMIRYFRSSADLDTSEMSSAINNFIAYSECAGIMIPYETDELGRRYCEQQLEKSNGFK